MNIFKAHKIFILGQALQAVRINFINYPLFESHVSRGQSLLQTLKKPARLFSRRLALENDIASSERAFSSSEAAFADNKKITIKVLNESLEQMAEQCKALNLQLSLKKIRAAQENIEKLSSDDIEVISERVYDELQNTLFIHIDHDRARFFNLGDASFGEDVVIACPTAAFEIDEAAKCLALSRPTACVFHLMRTMEIGIKAVAKCLSVPDPTKPSNNNWGQILQKIKAATDAKTAANSWQNEDKQFFEEIHATLNTVRSAWRNTTMHVENKYSYEEAENIFATVKFYMQTISKRMDETGAPLA